MTSDPTASGSLVPRVLTESDYPDWLRALHTGFLRPPTPSPEEIAIRLPHQNFPRMRGVFDEGRCVATFRSFAQEVTAVGGAPVAASAVTNVSVSPTHRRRGLLGRMMGAELAEAKERGDVLATLIAAEYPIYGRFGFGPATWLTRWKVDLRRAALDPRWSGPEDGGRIDLVDGEAVRKLGPELYDRARAVRHGMVSRAVRDWERRTGWDLPPGESWTEPFYATYRSASGELEGYVAYAADETWDEGKQPLNTLTVRDLIAVTPAAERALWRYVCAIDWVTFVESGNRAPDDLLPLLLPDPRAARVVTYADMMWVRVLDVVRALEARAYGTAGSLVLDVRDAAGLAGGRFRLDASPEGAACAPTAAPADLVLDVADLGALYLGDESVARLVALGRVEESAPGAAARADLLLRAPRRAWCPDIF
ncbi:GNAT family N-acetyltransferase [Streptomyces sp. TRM76323]|uniref:GNAT family N-acetyltransferase n=1 Tax=Streptomyces tamarix TaxID=3078565 RepID=A0ABU3QR06_9ACTN|nr:GNAT family N-acetyltransferase [Streptomyces tamarix]MDT9685179.1 GNAT family N-acetyltransferase [Streptomyces tamarix]